MKRVRVLWGLLVVGCSHLPPPETTPSAEAAATQEDDTFLGLRFAASLDATRAASPTLLAEGAESGAFSADGIHTVHGIDLQTHLVFREGQLATIVAYANPATLAEFETLTQSVQGSLGAGLPMECRSDAGLSFIETLETGHGSRHIEWDTAELRASIALQPISDGTIQLRASATWLPLLPPLDDDFVSNAPRSRAAKPDSACEEANGGPEFSFAGVFFGASFSEAQATFPAGRLLAGQASLPVEYGGVSGTATLMFYEDCLATGVFMADDASEANYRTLVAHLETLVGDGRLERCSPTGEAVDDALVRAERGSLQARWQHDVLAPQVSLSSSAGERRLVVEIEYLPLRHRAPEVNFSQ